jgi:hypothetical protein
LFILLSIQFIKGATKMDGQKDMRGAERWQAKGILTNASDTITERGTTHGHYDQTMLRTAKLWSTFLETQLEPNDVAICMALVKLARIMETKNVYDSWVDFVAYAAIAGELAVKDWNDLDAF